MNKIREVLKAQGRTQKWLAGELGKSYEAMNRWCRNINQPSIGELKTMSDKLGVTMEELVQA